MRNQGLIFHIVMVTGFFCSQLGWASDNDCRVYINPEQLSKMQSYAPIGTFHWSKVAEVITRKDKTYIVTRNKEQATFQLNLESWRYINVGGRTPEEITGTAALVHIDSDGIAFSKTETIKSDDRYLPASEIEKQRTDKVWQALDSLISCEAAHDNLPEMDPESLSTS